MGIYWYLSVSIGINLIHSQYDCREVLATILRAFGVSGVGFNNIRVEEDVALAPRELCVHYAIQLSILHNLCV